MNKRLALLSLGILLTGCQTTPPVTELEPQEVLHKTAESAQKLDSAQYIITADFSLDSGNTWQAEGVVRMDGVLQNAGEVVSVQSDVTAEVTDVTDGEYTMDGTIELVVLGDNDVYMNLHSLRTQPSSALFKPEMIGAIAGTWWKLPSQSAAPQSASITPDPRLLQAQAEVVTVTKNNGITEFAGVPAYHYDVALDTEKLMTYVAAIARDKGETVDIAEIRSSLANVKGNGEIWIDAETFFIHKLVWNIESLPQSTVGTADIALTLTLRNHNNAPTVVPPTEAKVFSPAIFFSLPPDALFDGEVPANDGQFEDLIDAVNTTY